MRVYILDYNTNKIKEISLLEFFDLVLTFDREQVKIDSNSRKEYYEVKENYSQENIDFFNNTKIDYSFHQDSERDIFVTF